jgi:hypothetical protein
MKCLDVTRPSGRENSKIQFIATSRSRYVRAKIFAKTKQQGPLSI